jgi:hypothetical protein
LWFWSADFMPCLTINRLKGKASALRVVVAAALLAVSPLAALAGTENVNHTFAGIYVTRLPKNAPSMSVSLGPDGSATVTQDPGQGSTTYFGQWSGNGTEVKVTFEAQEGSPQPAPMVFQLAHDKLQPVSWDREAWGKLQPPTMTKGYKVKYLFWSTTMR